jgi:hypothetical protein
VQSGKERGDADVSTAFMGMSRQAGRVAGSAGGCCCLKQRGSGCLVVPRVDPAAQAVGLSIELPYPGLSPLHCF